MFRSIRALIFEVQEYVSRNCAANSDRQRVNLGRLAADSQRQRSRLAMMHRDHTVCNSFRIFEPLSRLSENRFQCTSAKTLIVCHLVFCK